MARIRSNLSAIFLALFLFGCGASRNASLTVFHWNDFHAQNIPREVTSKDSSGVETRYRVGGAAILKHYLDSMRTTRPFSITLHAGDEFQGTPISSLTKGASQVRLLGEYGLDAFTFGNHEFDYGRENLERLFSKVGFPVVSADLWDKTRGRYFVKPVTIIKRGPLRIGVIGLAPKNLFSLSLRNNLRGLEVLPVEKVVRKFVRELRESGCDVVIVLSHLGYSGDKALARKVKGIDIIVGGHSHTALRRPVKINNTVIVQAGSRGRYLGVLDVKVDLDDDRLASWSGFLLETREGVKPDSLMQAVVDSLEAIAGKELNQVIGILETDWVRHYKSESNIGDWMADVTRDFTGSDVAFQNSGGIRKNLPAGEIKARDVWEIAPFGNYFVKFEVSGKVLRSMLEWQAAGKGEFCQVSGLRYVVKNRKLVSATVQGHPIDPDRVYSIATNNYVGDHLHDVFGLDESAVTVVPVKPNYLDRDVFIDYIKKQGRVRSVVQGRIRKEK